MKRILDTVHGSIFVDQQYIDKIIDSPLFQRLRRIEQSSIRSIFPSARHDRFVHSLGVFHVGLLIERHITQDRRRHNIGLPTTRKWFRLYPSNEKEAERLYKEITTSYRVACLLHDIAHAPFSHTFEEYYGTKQELAALLQKEANFSDTFNRELEAHIKDINYHEYASAYVVVKAYRNPIEDLRASVELIVRMIIGLQFSNTTDRYNQIANAYISLLHGDVIDADRLDYACRDVWASGYATSRIDVNRLISGINLVWVGNKYEICYDANVLNEIEGVLNVKDFQMNNVIHHHTVEYEQDLLKHAAEHMAIGLFRREKSGTTALRNIISTDAVIGSVMLPRVKVSISNIADDDLIFLIKNDCANDDYQEWASRDYKQFALWKTRDEFFAHFGKLFNGNRETDILLSKLKPIVLTAISHYGYSDKDLRIVEVEFKTRVSMDDIMVKIGNKRIKYCELVGKSCPKSKKIKFCYVYLSKNINGIVYRSKEFYLHKDKIMDEIYQALEAQLQAFLAPVDKK